MAAALRNRSRRPANHIQDRCRIILDLGDH